MNNCEKAAVALVEAGCPSVHVYSRTYLPRTGLPSMASILRQRGHSCDLWFQSMPGYDEERLKRYKIVGIGSLSGQIHEAYRLADSLRSSGVTVVMGGPHVTFMPEEAVEHCDYVIRGEGDLAFAQLVEVLMNGGDLDAVPGLAWKDNEGVAHRSEAMPEPVDYTKMPAPDFTLSPQVSPGRIPPIISTSRGCPHDCSFCSVTAVFGRRYRFKTNRQVIDELRPVLHRSVCFADDNFCAKPSRTKSLLADMIENDAVPLRWSGEMTVGAAKDTELLGLMQKTRCRIMYVGIESVIPETLKAFGKAHDVDSIAGSIENLHRHKIGIHGMFVLGVDDVPEVVDKIVDFSIHNDIDTIQIFALTPFPGTAAFGEHKDRLLHRDWKYYDGMHVVFRPNKCSASDMQEAIIDGMRRFYGIHRAIGGYRGGRRWRVKYRLGGNYILRKWIAQNADYVRRLRDM